MFFPFPALVLVLLSHLQNNRTLLATQIEHKQLTNKSTSLAEELVKFKKSIGERMLQSPDHKMNDGVNLLKLDKSFRSAWNVWLSTPLEEREEAAFRTFDDCSFNEEADVKEAER